MTLQLNAEKHTALTSRGEVSLTPREYAILDYLMTNDGKMCTSEEIYSNIWKAVPFRCRPLIAVHIRHIREKIESDPSRPSFLTSIWGYGYQFRMQ